MLNPINQKFLISFPFFCVFRVPGHYWSMIELAHVSVHIDLKDPLEKVKRTCALIEAVTRAKDDDELASVFVSRTKFWSVRITSMRPWLS